MTVSSTLNRVSTDGNGATTTFPVTFPFHNQADLVVISTVIATGVETVKTITTDYTIAGVLDPNHGYSAGGSVEFLVAPVSTERITIYRDPSAVQTLDLVENDNLPAEAVEAQFDYLTMLIQRVSDLITRSLHQPDGDSVSIGELPSAVARASKYLLFDSSGNPTAAVVVTPGSITVSAFIETLLDDANAAAARATLGASEVAPLDSVFRVRGSSDNTKQVAFEVDGLTAATTRTLTVQDENGTIALTSEFFYSSLLGSTGRLLFPPKHISGLTYSNNAGDATNDIDIAAGYCIDTTSAQNIFIDAITKRSDAAWVVGTAQGGLDTGSVGNSDYYIWAIKRADTGVCDVLFSLSSSAPTMPADYAYKRLIGWFKRVGGTIVAFNTYETSGGGLDYAWASPTLDVNLANTLTTARRTDAVKVPLNFSVIARINVVIDDASSGGAAYIYCPDATDLAPNLNAAPLANVGHTTGYSFVEEMHIRTSATGTIAARATVATVDLYEVATLGFTWARRN